MKVASCCILLLTLVFGAAPASAKTDTAYFRSYYKKLVVRLVQTYRAQDFYFSSILDGITTTNSFHTGNEAFLGADASYKWVGLSYSISLSPNVSRRNSSFQFNTSYKPLRFQFSASSFQNLNYSVTKLKSGAREDTVLSQRENNIEIITARLKLDYIFNYRKYGYSASFSQSGRQLKKAGSVIASVALTSDNFLMDNLSGNAKTIFDSTYGFSKTLIAGINAGVGYGYNWIPGKYWTISVVDIPNLAFQVINTQVADPGISYGTKGLVNHFKLGVAYNRGKWAVGFSARNIISASKIKPAAYSNIYNSADVYVGLIIDTKKKLLFVL